MFSKAFRSVANSQMRNEEKSQTFSDEELDYLRCSQSCDITRSGTIAAAPVSPFAPIELQAQSTGYFNRFNFGQAMTRAHNTQKQNENGSNDSNSNCSNSEGGTFFGKIEPLLNKSFESMKIDVLDNQVSSQFESVSDWNEVFITSKLTGNGNVNDNDNDNDNDNGNGNGIGLERRTRKEDGCMVKPRYYNEYKSCTMAETPVYVLKSVYALCNDYYNGNDSSNGDGKDIECVLNEKEFEIHGMVFLNNKGIKFVISVWHENEDNDNNNNNSTLTRIEFLKLRGDSLVFEQFWNEMYELMHSELNFKEINSICTRCNSNDFKSLFTLPPLTDFDDNDNSDSNSNNSGYNYCMTNDYLDDLAMDLKEDYAEDGMDALLTLCEKLNNNNSNVLFCRMVINNTMLVTVLIENIVCHCDIAYQRAALCVLNKLIILLNGNDKNECDKWISHLINESIILDQLILLLDKENQSKIVQKHSIRLLSNLLLLSKSGNKDNDNDKNKNKNVLNRKQFNCFQSIFKFLKVSKNIDCETKNMIDSLVGQLL